MYQPSFNSVLVQIDDSDAEWGGGNDEAMLGKSFSKGTVVAYGVLLATRDYPNVPEKILPEKESHIMWNEGTEAGTTFEHDGKLYGFIYWWDIRACQE